jgi:hypothetical protein
MPASAETLGDARHLFDRDALFHQLEQAVRRHFQPAGDGDAAAVGEQFQAQLRGEGFFEADVAPPGNADIAPLQFFGEGAQ